MIVASGFVGCLRTTYIINGGVQNLMGVDDRIRRLTPLAMRTLASTVLPRGGGNLQGDLGSEIRKRGRDREEHGEE